MIISERIFYMMEKKNMTQLELSKRTEIATSNISDWKKKKTNHKAGCLLSICDALEVTPEQLLTGKGIDPEYRDENMDYEVKKLNQQVKRNIERFPEDFMFRLSNSEIDSVRSQFVTSRKRDFLLDKKADVDIYHTHLQSKEFICLQQFFMEN